MKPEIHREITKNALPTGAWLRCKCCDNGREREISPVDIVVAANTGQDGVCGQFHNEYHCDNGAFAATIEFIKGQWQVIGTWDAMCSVCCDCKSIRKALQAFGRILHAVQDFYSHTSWVEGHAGKAGAPLWDPLGPPPEDTTSGSWPLGKGKPPPGGPSHGDLNKDSPSSEEGRKVVPDGPNKGHTLHDLAVQYALAASKKELERFRTRASHVVDCIEKKGVHPCAGCEHAMLHRAGGSETYAYALAHQGGSDIAVAQALDLATNAVLLADDVPVAAYQALRLTTPYDIIEQAREQLALLSETSVEGGPAGVLAYARSAVLLEAFRLVAPREVGRFVQASYSSRLGRDAKGVLLWAAAGAPSRESRAFLIDHVCDEDEVGRETSAYEIAIPALEARRHEGAALDLSDPAQREAFRARLLGEDGADEAEHPSN